MVEAARRDKNGVLQCAMVSQLGDSPNGVTSSSRGSSNQPISFLKLRRDMALCVTVALCTTGERRYKLRLLYGCRASSKGPIKQEQQPSRWPYRAPLKKSLSA